MRVLVQRVSEASVKVAGEVVGQIGPGLLLFVGVKRDDTTARARQLVQKITNLRIFTDGEGKMNRSLLDVSGELLVVSQFTLYGNTSKGNRPSYSDAADRDLAHDLYEYFVGQCRATAVRVETGIFQAHMEVSLVNEGPVTLMCYAES